MKRFSPLMWTLAGGLPACAAVLWIAGAPGVLNTNPSPADGQAAYSESVADQNKQVHTQAQEPAPSSSQDNQTPASLGSARRRLLDSLRWESLTPDQRRADLQLQSQQEQDEWQRLVEFLQKNSHNRYMLLIRMRQAPEPGSPTRTNLMQRWLQLEQLERTNPALFDLRVQEFREEDTMIGLAAEMRRARRANDQDSLNSLREKVHAEAVKLVDLDFAERELRIKNAQFLLDQEKNRLDQDRLNKDNLAGQRGRRLMQQFGIGNIGNSPSTRPTN